MTPKTQAAIPASQSLNETVPTHSPDTLLAVIMRKFIPGLYGHSAV